jgi:hypothetical protein
MKKWNLACIFALATMPVFAQIVDVQKHSSWTSSSATNCIVTLGSIPAATHLIVVWTDWRTSTQNTITASVADTQGGWPTFTFFVKVGTTRLDVTAFLLRPRVSWLGGQPSSALLRDE